jgi:aerobic-type carbon monoxide dehydrogenase small subunit (CoxS/CutS family)
LKVPSQSFSRINGRDRSLRIDPRTSLLDCIRESVVLTGTKKGCDTGSVALAQFTSTVGVLLHA